MKPREDNFQEVVYQLWRSFGSLKNKEKPASWIYAVAINTSISKIRKDQPLDFYASTPDIEIVNPDELQDKSENYQRLMDALYKLNVIDRSNMLLVHQQNPTRMVIDACALAILLATYFLWERSAYKMRKYSNKMPVKKMVGVSDKRAKEKHKIQYKI